VPPDPPHAEPPKEGHEGRGTPVHYWVEYRGNTIELRGGQLLIGRSAMCRLVLDDPLVSRQHAEFRQVGDSVFLFDLKSVNGVFLNGKRVDQKQEVRPGDKVLIGEQEMTLVARSVDKETKPHVPSRRRFIETLHASDSKTDGAKAASVAARAGGEQSSSTSPTADNPLVEPKPAMSDSTDDLTFQGEALELLTGVADKVLALKRGDEAERILGACMTNLLEAARSGAIVGPKTGDKAAAYSVKLAAVTGKGGWIDYAITLFTTLKRPLPGVVVDELYGLLRKTSGVDLAGIREYVAVLHASQTRFGPAERFLVQRIEGLERLASLR
jgi:pSer/pThr/pTyr-binding forkhead associated (FHA) protein